MNEDPYETYAFKDLHLIRSAAYQMDFIYIQEASCTSKTAPISDLYIAKPTTFAHHFFLQTNDFNDKQQCLAALFPIPFLKHLSDSLDTIARVATT